MKRFALITAFLIVIAGLAGCGSKPGAAPPATTGSLQTLPADSQSPEDVQPSGTEPADTDNLSDFDEPDIPELTPWTEPASVDYQGSYLPVAQDADASKYPMLNVTQEVQIMLGDTGATLKIPSSWKLDDPDGIPTLVDAKNRSVGQIYLTCAYINEPYFALLPDGGTPMLWEKPGQYQYGARSLTLESDTTTAMDDKKTIIKIVGLMNDETYADEDGSEYYLVYCLSFDKAYVDGNNVDYVVSNKTIDEIAQSFQAIDMGE
jgi:hypothetical protein